MQNIQRSEAFIKIKHTIRSASSYRHLEIPDVMIYNLSASKGNKDEIVILREYLNDARTKFTPPPTITPYQRAINLHAAGQHRVDIFEDLLHEFTDKTPEFLESIITEAIEDFKEKQILLENIN